MDAAGGCDSEVSGTSQGYVLGVLGATVKKPRAIQSFSGLPLILAACCSCRLGTGCSILPSEAAYGEGWMKPKHHWQMDVPRHTQRDGLVLDAFVIERTHLAVKA